MKEKIDTKKEQEKQFCNECGGFSDKHGRMWHRTHCEKVKKRVCQRCKALLPRHYPGCDQDTLNFTRWWIPASLTSDLWKAYHNMKREAIETGKYQEPPGIIDLLDIEEPNEPDINPVLGQKILKEIDVMQKCESEEERNQRRLLIHDMINSADPRSFNHLQFEAVRTELRNLRSKLERVADNKQLESSYYWPVEGDDTHTRVIKKLRRKEAGLDDELPDSIDKYRDKYPRDRRSDPVPAHELRRRGSAAVPRESQETQGDERGPGSSGRCTV